MLVSIASHWHIMGVLCLLVSCTPEISRRDRQGAKIHYDIAVTELGNNNLRSALRELLIANDLDPSLPQTHNALGLVYHRLGKGEKSIEHYLRAVQLKPDFSSAHNNLGTVLLASGRYDEAISAFKKALSDILYPTPALAEGHMGWAFHKKGDNTKALMYLRNALAKDPTFCLAYGWLARVNLEEKKLLDTIANLERFEKYCVKDPEAKKNVDETFLHEMRFLQGVAYLRKGDTPSAREAFSSCTTGDDTFAIKCKTSLDELPSTP